MKVRDIMSDQVIRIHPDEPVTVAARTLEHYNVGVLPVCGNDGKICGVITDRDIVIRCLASGRSPSATTVKDVMTAQVVSAKPDMDAAVAAHLMGRQQVRRLPVLENGRLCGMLSLGDLAQSEESSIDASDALTDITSQISER